jgi:hypothetical protein
MINVAAVLTAGILFTSASLTDNPVYINRSLIDKPVIQLTMTWDTQDSPMVCAFKVCDDASHDQELCSVVSPLVATFVLESQCSVWVKCFERDALLGLECIDCTLIGIDTVPVRLDWLFGDGFETGDAGQWDSSAGLR